jgi:Tfp pilus assembly protein PilF/DNA-binding CsgD family transcriptional regulator
MFKILFRLYLLLVFACFFFEGHASDRSYYDELSQKYQKAYIDKDFSNSLKYLLEMKSLAETNNWKDLQVDVLNDMGHFYSTVLEYDKAMQYFTQSYEIAVSQQNLKGQTLALSNIGWLYSLEGNFRESQKYAKRAYDLSLKANDSVRIGQMAMNLAAAANTVGELGMAEKYIDIALEMLKNRQSIVGMPHAVTVKIENLYLKEEYKKAEQLALSYIDQFPEKQIDDIKAQFFFFLSKIYRKQDDFSNAVFYAHEALKAQPSLKHAVDICEHLSDLYQDNKQFELALSYKDFAMMAKDSLVKINEMDRITNNQIRIELSNSEKKLLENQLKQKADRRFFIGLIFSIFVLACIVIWILRIKSVKDKQEKIISENKRQITELELDKEKNRQKLLEQQLREQETISLLEQERLNNEIEAKNRQLTAKVLFQTNRNKLIDEIIGVFLKNPELMETPSIQSLYHKLKMERQESVNNGFLVYFEQLNPVFLSFLKERHPNLTANDIRMLSYIYLNLSTKEIANLLNVQSDSLKKKKQRLAAKLGIDTTELYNYLTSI